MKAIPVLIALLVSLLVQLPARSEVNVTSDDPPYPCPYTAGAYYQPGVFPRYDAGTRALVLADASGTTVRTIDTIEENVRIINWSPDCHYLTGAVGLVSYYRDEPDPFLNGQVTVWWQHKDVVIWDATTGSRAATIKDHPGKYLNVDVPSPIIWRPDSAYALIVTGCCGGDFLWARETNQSCRVEILLPNQWLMKSRASFLESYWDLARGWLWGSGEGVVTAFDINTCEVVRFYQSIPLTWVETHFRFSPDNTLVIAYTVNEAGHTGEGSISLYNIETAEAIAINAEGFVAPYIPHADYHPVALSADNRYLIAGYTAIRVWDIQNLPERVEDRLPIYRHAGPEANIWSVRFSDWGVIETTSEEGTQHWDLHTGAFIP